MKILANAGWLLLPVVAATLPNCSLLRVLAPAATAGYRLVATATIRNADGEDFHVTDTDAVFAGGMAAIEVFGVPDGGDVSTMQHQWKLYLSRRFQQGPATPEFVAHFGRSPYCVLHTDLASSRDRFTGTPVAEDESWHEPTVCPEDPGTGTCRGPDDHPQLQLTPASALEFGPLPLGAAPTRLSLTLENGGAGRLCLDAPRLSPSSSDPDDFLLDPGDCRPLDGPETMLGRAILSASTRTSCTMYVDFGPRDPGSRSARLLIASNDYALPHAPVDLRGTGEAGMLTASPSSLCLNVPPEVIDGMTCRRRPLGLHNAGPGAVTIGSASVAATAVNWHLDLPAGLSLPFTIAAGDTVNVTVRECGTTPEDSTFLTINSNATESMVAVPMSGPTTGCTP